MEEFLKTDLLVLFILGKCVPYVCVCQWGVVVLSDDSYLSNPFHSQHSFDVFKVSGKKKKAELNIF